MHFLNDTVALARVTTEQFAAVPCEIKYIIARPLGKKGNKETGPELENHYKKNGKETNLFDGGGNVPEMRLLEETNVYLSFI